MLAWIFWQSPNPAPTPLTIKTALPPQSLEGDSINNSNSQQLWRVITRRVTSADGLRALSNRLNKLNVKAIAIQHIEKLNMHAFDDVELFKNRKMANIAAEVWKAHGIATNTIRADKGVYLLSLGRFHQISYAKAMQQRLKRIRRKHRYQQRIIPIPTWIFTFTPVNKQDSEKLWRKLNQTGLIRPVMMTEESFQALYGKSIKP